jgi:hypothetical protein
MSVIDVDKVDSISIDRTNGLVKLTIADHLDWEDPLSHLLLLQDKINAYLAFYESGQMYQSYPKSKGREVRINVVTKFPVPGEGLEFFAKTNEVLNNIGLSITHSLLEE